MSVKTKADPALLAQLAVTAKSLTLSIPTLTEKGKTFEAWTLFEVALRLSIMPGINVQAFGHDDNPIPDFHFRGAPGHIPPANAQGIQPSHFRAWREGKVPVELHLSLEHRGASTTLHELDISVIGRVDAMKLRFEGGGAFAGHRYVALELKAYDAGTILPKTIPRALIGAAVDLDLGVVVEHKIIFARAHGALVASFRAPKHWLLTTAALGVESQTYLDAYHIGHKGQVGPTNDLALNDVADEIASIL